MTLSPHATMPETSAAAAEVTGIVSEVHRSERKKPVIRDVADLAGVSVPTVSRVLTGVTRVSDDKRERVLRAIQELDYYPSAAARALVAGRPTSIAIIAGNTSRYGYAETIRGIEERARSAGMTLTIVVVESDEARVVSQAIRMVSSQPLAGLIVLAFDSAGITALQQLPPRLPVVSVSGWKQDGQAQATMAEEEGAEIIVSHLLELGHSTVHHVRVPPALGEDPRTVGWRRALEAAGVTPPKLIDATWDPQSGRLIGIELANRLDVSAVFCGNDEIAMGLMRGLSEAGRRVPQDISVVGFDDHPLAALWVPSLTTVRQDFAALGASAYAMLDGLINGRTPPLLTIQSTQAIIRESAASPSSPAIR